MRFFRQSFCVILASTCFCNVFAAVDPKLQALVEAAREKHQKVLCAADLLQDISPNLDSPEAKAFDREKILTQFASGDYQQIMDATFAISMIRNPYLTVGLGAVGTEARFQYFQKIWSAGDEKAIEQFEGDMWRLTAENTKKFGVNNRDFYEKVVWPNLENVESPFSSLAWRQTLDDYHSGYWKMMRVAELSRLSKDKAGALAHMAFMSPTEVLQELDKSVPVMLWDLLVKMHAARATIRKFEAHLEVTHLNRNMGTKLSDQAIEATTLMEKNLKEIKSALETLEDGTLYSIGKFEMIYADLIKRPAEFHFTVFHFHLNNNLQVYRQGLDGVNKMLVEAEMRLNQLMRALNISPGLVAFQLDNVQTTYALGQLMAAASLGERAKILNLIMQNRFTAEELKTAQNRAKTPEIKRLLGMFIL